MMSTDMIVGIVALVAGCLLGYIVAAHNSKANKEQVSALEAKVSEISEQVKHPTILVAQGTNQVSPAFETETVTPATAPVAPVDAAEVK